MYVLYSHCIKNGLKQKVHHVLIFKQDVLSTSIVFVPHSHNLCQINNCFNLFLPNNINSNSINLRFKVKNVLQLC